MPVPVTTSNPDGKGLTTHKNQALPSKGSLFSRLGADSATRAMEDKQKEQAVHWKERRAAANGDTPGETATVPDAAANGSAPAIVVDNLEFKYTGDDGAPLPGAQRPISAGSRAAAHRLGPGNTHEQSSAFISHAHSRNVGQFGQWGADITHAAATSLPPSRAHAWGYASMRLRL